MILPLQKNKTVYVPKKFTPAEEIFSAWKHLKIRLPGKHEYCKKIFQCNG